MQLYLQSIIMKYWDKIVLFMGIFIIYYSVFQFHYFFNDDYSELLLGSHYDFWIYFNDFVGRNGRPLQIVIQEVIRQYIKSTYYNYDVLRFISIFTVYTLSLLILKLFNNALNDKFISLAITIFLFSTPIFSIQVLWIDVYMTTISYIIAVSSTFAFISLYRKSNKTIHKILIALITIIPLVITEFTYQSGTATPIAIVTILLLLNPKSVTFEHRSTNNQNFYYRYILPNIIKYQLVFTTIILVCLTQLVYIETLKPILKHFNIEMSDRAGTSLGKSINYTIHNIWNMKSAYLSHYYYFNSMGRYVIHKFGLLCIIISLYGIYKEIKSKYDKDNKNEFINTNIKWLVVLLCVGVNSFLFVIHPAYDSRTKTMQAMLLFVILIYSLNVIFDFKKIIHSISDKLTTPTNIVKNTTLIFITTIITFIGYFENMNGFVYIKSIEDIYLKSSILSQMMAKPNATQIALIQSPGNYYDANRPLTYSPCYFGGCIGEYSYEITFTSSVPWGAIAVSGTLWEMNIDIKKFNITEVYPWQATSENIAKYNNNDTILIDVNALDKAFQLTYKK